MNNLILFNDLLLLPFYLLIIYFVGYVIKNRNLNNYPEYKYFIYGLTFKIVGVISFCLIYIFYYEGGDTINYFLGAKAITNLLLQDFEKGYAFYLIHSYFNSISSFNFQTGYPPLYMFKGDSTFNVCRYSTCFTLIGFNSFLVSSILVACFSYVGVWKFYRLLNILYPNYSKQFAFIILFLPSLIFWGSGIMKDSFVLSSTCWISYNFYKTFIVRESFIANILLLILNLFIIININHT